jgi:putative membrane protein
MYLLLALLLNSLALIITSKVVPGFMLADYGSALLAAVVLGVINTFIKPVLLFLTAPLNFLTLGLFTFVVNAIVLVMTDTVIDGMKIDHFWPTAILAALVLSLISTILSMLLQDFNLVKVGKRR